MIDKERALRDTLSSLGAVVVAYSGGVDSAYLACVAYDTLGERAVAVTADSPSYPERHRQMAVQIAAQFGFRHEIIQTSELERPEYRANPANRCYYCKHELYTALTGVAAARGGGVMLQKYKDSEIADIKTFVIADGLTWKLGDKTRTESNLRDWLGERAQAGRLPPNGFPKSGKFG